MRRRLDRAAYVEGVRAGDRAALARTITLVESSRADDQELGDEVLRELLPRTGGALRVGVTGIPGVGKSTFLDALGMLLVERGRRVAVLAVDPSSRSTGGSILGDKTRMARLSRDERAFIRPSPAAGALGGVARRTRETILLCEAAGFDVVLVETVGVGQSETVVADLVDFFLLLALPAAGDELQGIKKGILELADAVVVNKADGDLLPFAREAMRELSAALRYGARAPRSRGFEPQVLLASAREGAGIAEAWELIERHRSVTSASGERTRLRAEQVERAVWSLAEEALLSAFAGDPRVCAERDGLRGAPLTPYAAARRLVDVFRAKA